MTVRPLDLSRLAKILALTTSPSDGEALAAARKAASLVEKAGLDYSRLFFEHLPRQTLASLSTSDQERELRNLRAEVATLRQRAREPRKLASERLRRQLPCPTARLGHDSNSGRVYT